MGEMADLALKEEYLETANCQRYQQMSDLKRLLHLRNAFHSKYQNASAAKTIKQMGEQGYFKYLNALQRVNVLIADRLKINIVLVDVVVLEIKNHEKSLDNSTIIHVFKQSN
ncbi:hypothetical protein [Nostoc sp. ChiQUE01b]|uniref:hypothetical protein n=1 Tax=Nostoc sp. ChiQUE01b TaxID=3075376 RepID=UPI002AD45B6C|nr:hypothetical protein [Nostoc sp. ChiQUE01b]MDZ8264355.1 hypothetical protein [Nostoc sp. ChiQUE01b]